MALKYEDQVAYVIAGTSLTITPADNESIRIKSIGIATSTAGTTATITTDRTKVGFIEAYFNSRDMFPLPVEAAVGINPYQNENFNTVDLTYPVANGESWNITATNNSTIQVVYDIYDAEDVKNTEPNGSHSTILNFFQYLTIGASWTPGATLAYNDFDTNLNPSDFPAFPVKAVPAGQEFDIHAVGCQALARGDGTNNDVYTQRLRMKYNREVLFDESGYGWYVLGDSSHTANSYDAVPVYNTVPYKQDYTRNVKRFSTPLTFKQGDELLVEQGALGDAAGAFEANKLIVWLLMTQRRL